MDFRETYAPARNLATFQYLIPPVGKCHWNIDDLDAVTPSLNPEVDGDDIYMTLPKGWPDGLQSPAIIV